MKEKAFATALVTIAGITTGNFLWEFFSKIPRWDVAVEKSYEAAVAIGIFMFLMSVKIPSRKAKK